MKHKKISCYLPKSVEARVNRSRQENPRDWVNIYMYNDNRKRMTYGEDFTVEENEPLLLDGGQSYNKKTLYKDSMLSKKDDLFDYYKILKTDKKKKNYIKKRKKATNKSKALVPPEPYIKIIPGTVTVKF